MNAVLNSTSYMYGIVTKIIHETGMSACAKGYRYVRAAILIKLTDKSSVYAPVGNLYLDVAAVFKTTAECVERDIRYSLSSAWEKNNKKFAHSIFGDGVSSKRPTNSEFISAVAETVRRRYCI